MMTSVWCGARRAWSAALTGAVVGYAVARAARAARARQATERPAEGSGGGAEPRATAAGAAERAVGRLGATARLATAAAVPVPGGAPAAQAGYDGPDLPDEALAARVRDQGAVPAGVEVAAEAGAVVLFGRIPRHAHAALLQRVARIEGVRDVEDRLTAVDLFAPERPPGPPDPP